jgi:polysaccharide biosynthesis/export protein
MALQWRSACNDGPDMSPTSTAYVWFARLSALACGVIVLMASAASAGQSASPANTPDLGANAASVDGDYIIGSNDILSIVFWHEKEMSSDVVVRPDGKISVPLLKDVRAAGYTPEQLGSVLSTAAARFLTDPVATVIVKEIHSRNVFVVGSVAKSGTVALQGDMNVLQVIAEAGGLLDYADQDNIQILRNENGRQIRIKFSYKEVQKGENMKQNILLRPGDTVLVR